MEVFHVTFDKHYFKKHGISADRKFSFNFYSKIMRKKKKGGLLLEIGCSHGFLLKRLEKHFETFGIDISSSALNECRKGCKRSGISLQNSNKLGFKNNSFEMVLALHVFEHLKDPKETISEIHRVLKRDGILIFVVPNTRSLMKKLKGKNWFGYRDETHISLLSPKEWLELLKIEKFGIESVYSDGFWDVPYIPILPKFFQKFYFGFFTGIQFLSGILFIPLKLGENMIVVARK
jgi:SAM-dependent methyltransferase